MDVNTASRRRSVPRGGSVPRRRGVPRTMRDGPRALLLRAVLAGLVAIAAARLHAAYDPGVLCPLRRLTGVPCPLCGSTTAVVELGEGQLGRAFAAQPTTMTFLGVLVAAPDRLIGWLRRLAARPRLLLACVALIGAGSWLYQIFRFDVL